MAFYQKTQKGYILRVRLTPNSSCCAFGGTIQNAEGDEYLKVHIISVPEKGKANKELLDFLAKTLHLSKSSFLLISGQTDRWKKISITTDQSIEQKLEEMLNDGNNH